MSRNILYWILALTSAITIAILIRPLWSLRAAVLLFFTALMGAALSCLFSKQNDESTLSRLLPVKETNPEALSTGNFASTEDLFEAIMNGMREGVLVVDQSLRVVASNHAASEIFNHISGPLEKHRLSDLTRHSSVYTAFNSAINDNERCEVKVDFSVGNRRSFDLRVVPLRLNVEKNPCGAIGVFFDISQLERLERVRQEFLSNVSHELRTPLTAILAFVETLEDGAINDNENNKRFLSVIRKNASRMHSLIDDILELSAIEAGTVSVEPENVHLHPLVTDVITALAARTQTRNVIIRNSVGIGATVYADARRLEQMLTNLIDNAIKFNRDGGEVVVSHERNSQHDRLSVLDTGEGIPEDHVARIFERFYRVDRARSRDMGGTGLGLAIVKHLTRAHGGEVSVQSTPGKGSTFIIDLPSKQIAQSSPAVIEHNQVA